METKDIRKTSRDIEQTGGELRWKGRVNALKGRNRGGGFVLTELCCTMPNASRS